VLNANVTNLNLTSREDYPLFLDGFKNKSSEGQGAKLLGNAKAQRNAEYRKTPNKDTSAVSLKSWEKQAHIVQ
jgi:hypothetical protein